MSKFSSFLAKFGPEQRSLAGALTSIVAGIALQPKEREIVEAVIAGLEKTADNLETAAKSADQYVTKTQVAQMIKEALASKKG